MINKLKSKTKNNGGITLIALIITIVVLLILAAVSISMLTGDNGILKQANNAKTANQVAQIEEQIELWKIENQMSKYTGGTQKSLETFLQELVTQGLLTQAQADEVLASETKELVIGGKTVSFLQEGEVARKSQPYIEKLSYVRNGNNLNIEAVAYEVRAIDEQYVGTLAKAEGATYGFVTGTSGLESSNAGVDDSTSDSYITVDLTNFTGETYIVKIETTISSESGYDFGYIKVTDSNAAITDWSGSELEISGEDSNTANIELTGGQKYYIHFGYVKDDYADSNVGDDKFTINSIEILQKKTDTDLTYTYTINGEQKASSTSSSSTIAIDTTKLVGQEAVEGTSPKIPQGFRHLEGTMNEGYVITDLDQNYSVSLEVKNSKGTAATETLEITGNEFVWIPVDGTNVTLGYTSFNKGKAQSSYTESEDETAYEQYITENKGFYVGRYEAGIPDGAEWNPDATNSATSDYYGNVTGVPVSKKGATVWTSIDWTNANASAQKMYEGREDIASRLMTNKTWDTMLNWMISTGNTEEEKDSIQAEVADSRMWGNCSNSQSPANITGYGIKQKAGYSEYWSKCNIYDVAGNVWEWTTDKYGSSNRANRGGDYGDYGEDSSAVYRSYNSESNHYDGKRLPFCALYIVALCPEAERYII